MTSAAERTDGAADVEVLTDIERRVLWLASSVVHHANRVRPNTSGLKVGGHQASCASMVSIMTSLWFKHLTPGDRVSVKPHASPVLHAINYLLGRLDESYLTELRAFGGLQSYPSRAKDPDPVDFSTGSVGIGATATIGILIPSAISEADSAAELEFTAKLSLGLSVLLIAAYGLGLLFSLKTHRELFGGAEHAEAGEAPWPLGLALATLAGVTVLVALVSEVFVESVQKAAVSFGMSQAFVGFIVVALVGGAAEMASAFSAARKNRLDLSVGIALGSASQIALFVAPILVLLSYFLGPTPMDLQFWPGAVVMMLFATLTASLVTTSGKSAWFVGVLALMVYLIFAMTLYLLPPRAA